MAEKQDIAMNQFPVVTDLSYVYGEKSNNQNKITVEYLARQIGLYHMAKVFSPGEELRLPFTSGLMIVQNRSSYHEKSVATLFTNKNGVIIIPGKGVNFFSEVEDAICIFSTENSANYIIKNTGKSNQNIEFTFIR